MINESLKLKGRIELLENGEIVRAMDNMIMYTPFYNIIKMFINFAAPDVYLKYCAVGTGTTTVTQNDTQLATELARIYYTNLYLSGFQLISEFTFTKAEAIGALAEVGFFVGATATATANTGTMWSRALISPVYTKTADKELTIRRIDQWSKG
jgi:ABC-type proline/glycine betaine transport system ATPase subunit